MDIYSAGTRSKNMKFSLLSTYNASMLGNFLEIFFRKRIPLDSIILDSKLLSDKDILIFDERTGGSWKTGSIYGKFSHGIPFFLVDRHDDAATIELIRGRNIDYCVNAGTPRILKEQFLMAPTVGVLNVHPGILPKYRGSCAVEWSVFNDDPVGNTVHLMAPGIDAGPILRTRTVDCYKTDTYADLRSRVYEDGLDLISEVAVDILRGELKESDAEEQDQTKSMYFKPMNSSDHEIVKQKLLTGSYKFQKGDSGY